MSKGKPIPPRLAQRLLLRILRDDLAEEVLGDLEEKFYESLKSKSLFRTRVNYWWQVVNYLRPFALRNSHSSFNQYTMLQSYFKIGWRSLLRQKMYSLIKIGGFAMGLAACFLIALFIRDELQYDQHVPEGDHIYRVIGVFDNGDETSKDVWFAAPFASAIQQDYPEIEKAGRLNPVPLFGAGSNEVRRADKPDNSYDEGFTFADQEFLDVFQIPIINGNRDKALTNPNSIIISESKARKYFPHEDPIGKILIINENENKPYMITAVMQDFPATSHLNYSFLITLEGANFYPGEQTNWGASNYPTYIKVSPQTKIRELEAKMTKGVIEKYVRPMLLDQGVPNVDEMLSKGRLELQPLHDIHLHSQGIHDRLNHGDIRFVWLFGGVAVLILILACVNFINLATARSANRAKEVGIRKSIGSMRSHLVNQFLTESVILSFIAFVIGALLTALLLPYFNNLAGKALIFPWTAWWMIPVLVAASLLIGGLAGCYPAFYLSSFKPVQVLKGSVSQGSKNSMTRNLLVIFQFTTSIVLIVGTFVIYGQMDFILNSKLGFDKEQVILLQGTNTLGRQVFTLKEELKTLPNVKSVSISDYLPVRGTKRNGNSFWKEGMVGTENGVVAQRWRVDHDYINTLGMQLVEGRDFAPDMPTDSGTVIINEAMVRQLGLSNPIGERITNNAATWSVIGVVKDFHFESMKDEIRPVCLNLALSPSTISVKLAGTDMQSSIASITQVWNKMSPNQPIRFSFLDESYARTYADVQRLGKIFTSFAVFAIIVACLGLFGLSVFMVSQRSKEISIRIVLGASMQSILQLLTRNFVLLVVISFAIAVPIAWYTMQTWLQDYVYRIEITWEVFAYAGAIALLIAFLTVSYQSIKAALENPVNGLRSE